MTVKESFFRDIMRLAVWYPLRWLILVLPVRGGILVLRTMGDMHYLLSRGKKRMLNRNLSLVLRGGGGDIAASAIREYFRNHYIDRLLIFIFPKFNKAAVGGLAAISGLEHLDSALKKGRGAVLVHGHFGPVHLPLVSLAVLGYRMKQVGLPSDEGLSWIGRHVAFRLRLKYEAMIPAEIINADTFLRPVFRWLAENGVIMITGDGSGTERRVGKHVELKFFGQPFMFPLGPSIIAQKTGAELIPMFIHPGENGTYEVIIEEPLSSVLQGDERALDMTRKFAERLEHHILLHPGYMHFLDRFAPGALIQPAGDSSMVSA